MESKRNSFPGQFESGGVDVTQNSDADDQPHDDAIQDEEEMTADERSAREGDEDAADPGRGVVSKLTAATAPIKEAAGPLKDAAARGGESISSTLKGGGDSRRMRSKKVLIPVAAAATAAGVALVWNRRDLRERLVSKGNQQGEDGEQGSLAQVSEKAQTTVREALTKTWDGLQRAKDLVGTGGKDLVGMVGGGAGEMRAPSANGDESDAVGDGAEVQETESQPAKSEREREEARRERDARRRERRQTQRA